MATHTETINGLTAAYVGVRDSGDADAVHEAARALADAMADIFNNRFVACTDDDREIRVPHKSSQDAYRETWRKEGANVSTSTLRIVVMPGETAWHRGEGRNDRP